MKALHSARAAFIASENDTRIKRALLRNVRTTGETKYITGDLVLFKRDDDSKWHGPGIAIGQTGQQVFVKHGSFYVRVHPCRLQLVKPTGRMLVGNKTDASTNTESDNENLDESSSKEESTEKYNDHSDDDDDNDYGNKKLGQKNESAEAETEESDDRNTGVHQIEQQEDQDDPHKESTIADNVVTSNVTHSEFQTTKSNLKAIKPNVQIRYKLNGNSEWMEAVVEKRSGKATSKKYGNEWNVKCKDGSIKQVNFEAVSKWKIAEPCQTAHIHNQDDETIINEVYISVSKEEEIKAKMLEMAEWKKREVYTELEDNGQECVSLRWVVEPKVFDGKLGVKARLCCRGFEEEKSFRTDSPTCSREGV